MGEGSYALCISRKCGIQATSGGSADTCGMSVGGCEVGVMDCERRVMTRMLPWLDRTNGRANVTVF